MIRPFGWINSLVAMVVSMFRVTFPISDEGGWSMRSEMRVLMHVLFPAFSIRHQGMQRVLHASRAGPYKQGLMVFGHRLRNINAT